MKPRILVVEDERIVAMDIAATLRRLGYEVVGTAGSGQTAIEEAESKKPDLILMDIRLKGTMDGIEAAKIIQQRRPTPIIFLTAHTDSDTVERAKDAAPYRYIVKPFDEGALRRAVEFALKRVATERAERDRALEERWQSEEVFRLLVDAVKEYAIFMMDPYYRIATWNPGAERMTGFTADDVLGKHIASMRPPDTKAEDIESVFARIRANGSAEWDEAGIRKNGSTFLAHVYSTTLLSRTGELIGYINITRDVTEQRSLEAQLAQAQKLESLGQLAGGVAHDFNNMLMVIFARCDLLLHRLESEAHRHWVTDIRNAAMKNRELTQQLLAATRQQVLEPQVVNLNETVISAVNLLRPTLGEQINIQTELEEPLWSVYADATKLHQVLLNLAINARDAMPDGGDLTIESRNVRVDAMYARQHIGVLEGDYVSLVVSDTGTGIPLSVREHIYDPFYTTKEPGRGTGLGLAVVRGIVDQSGGRIWMYSEEGRGTTFKVFLPRYAGTATYETVAEESAPQRGRETILLVEDEELLRCILRETLEEQGYVVLEARQPSEALAIGERPDQPIDLLLTDVIMPGMTGIQLAELIVAAKPRIRLIFMSGYTGRSLTNGHALPSEVRFLEKPIMTSALLRTLREVFDEA